jgi:RNA polymerase sigma factor (sigma-70 family)
MTDETLMEAVKNGDLTQATLLFERYQRPIFAFLVRMTIDRAIAEDLTQNVFLRMIRYRTSFRGGNSFKAWIYQIARNVFMDHYQKERKMPTRYTDVSEWADAIPDQEDTDQSERERVLHISMTKLSEEQRELLILTRFQHMKYEEVAVIMNTTVANIKVKVHRAIHKLREHYFELEKA